jgi:hypothetical protein
MSRQVSRRPARGRKATGNKGTRNKAAANKASPDRAARKQAATTKTPPMRSSPSKSSREKVQAFRQRMRLKGLRLAQLWVPDTRNVQFATEARRQSRLANKSPCAAEDQTWVDSLSDWNTV